MNEHDNDLSETFPKLKKVILLLVSGLFLSLATTLLLQDFENSFQIAVGQLCIILPLILYVRAQKLNLKIVFRLNRVSPKLLAASLILGISLPLLNDELDRIINIIMPMSEEQIQILLEVLVAKTGLDWFFLLIGVVLVAAIGEEVIFRGLIQQILERRFDILQAIVVTALIFGLIHPTPWFLQVVFMGSLLGYIAWRANSVIPSMIIHAFHNTFALLSMNWQGDSPQWYEWGPHVHPTVIAIAACIIFYSFKWFNQLCDLGKEKS